MGGAAHVLAALGFSLPEYVPNVRLSVLLLLIFPLLLISASLMTARRQGKLGTICDRLGHRRGLLRSHSCIGLVVRVRKPRSKFRHLVPDRCGRDGIEPLGRIWEVEQASVWRRERRPTPDAFGLTPMTTVSRALRTSRDLRSPAPGIASAGDPYADARSQGCGSHLESRRPKRRLR
jgi:hypothetical protein